MSPKQTRKFQTEKKTTTKEGKREYMRKYMRALKKDKLTVDFKKALIIIQRKLVENRILRTELQLAVKLFHEAHKITRDPGLTDTEKVFLIKNLKVPIPLIQYLNRLENKKEMIKIE